jgi:hypothetical protein
MKKPRGKADQEAWFRRFGADPKTGRIRGKILTGSCPVSFSLRELWRAILANQGKEADLDAHIDLDLGCTFGWDYRSAGMISKEDSDNPEKEGVYTSRYVPSLRSYNRLTFTEFRFTSMHDGRRIGRRHGRMDDDMDEGSFFRLAVFVV